MLSSAVAKSDVAAWVVSRLAAPLAANRQLLVLFLHGYMSPTAPDLEVLEAALKPMGLAVWHATAPEGREDPFNHWGSASWFRYDSDHRAALPIAFDRPDMSDVRTTLHEPLVALRGDGAPGRLVSLVEALQLACRRWNVLLCGESQGGVMATLLAAEWLRGEREGAGRLAGVYMLRSAPDPATWSPSWPDDEGRDASRLGSLSWGAFVGGSDDVFPEHFVRYAMSPLGTVPIAVAKGVTHYDDSIYLRAFATFLLWALRAK